MAMITKEVNTEYTLMPEEIKKFEEFKKVHKQCAMKASKNIPDDAENEDCCPMSVSYIIMRFSGIGMWPHAKCEICGKEESIGCNERVDNI